MIKILQNLFYNVFRSEKKRIYLERDEIKLSMRVLKNELTDEQRRKSAEQAFLKIEKLKQFQESKKILIFWSKDLDIPSQNFILKWCEKKEILLPSIKSDKLKIKQFVGLQETSKENSFHFEPKTKPYDGEIDLAIIPSIAFDGEKNRMGQGRGYYNGFLKYKNIYTVGVGFDFQVIDEIPLYWRDVKVNVIFTPNKTIS
jgi:5-formyltetrahydrofolate cyclo-ligase